VGARGAGNVEKSSAASTSIQTPAKRRKTPRNITMQPAVLQRQHSVRSRSVAVGTIATAVRDGRPNRIDLI